MNRTIFCAAVAALASILSTGTDAFDANQYAMLDQAPAPDAEDMLKNGVGYSSPMGVHASSFLNAGGPNYQFFFNSVQGTVNGNNGGTCMMAPVHLPVGVRVFALYMHFVDNHTSNLTMHLRRKYVLDESASEVMATVTTSGAPPSQSPQTVGTISIANGLVPSQYYHYFLTFCLPDTQEVEFLTAQVYYHDG